MVQNVMEDNKEWPYRFWSIKDTHSIQVYKYLSYKKNVYYHVNTTDQCYMYCHVNTTEQCDMYCHVNTTEQCGIYCHVNSTEQCDCLKFIIDVYYISSISTSLTFVDVKVFV